MAGRPNKLLKQFATIQALSECFVCHVCLEDVDKKLDSVLFKNEEPSI